MITLEDIAAQLTRIEQQLAKPKAQPQAPVVADDAELDSQYGDPVVYDDPKFWKGDPFKGVRFSQCPYDYLMVLARSLESRADWQDENSKVDKKGNPASMWSRKDAARARGWAARNKVKEAIAPGGEQDDINF